MNQKQIANFWKVIGLILSYNIEKENKEPWYYKMHFYPLKMVSF